MWPIWRILFLASALASTSAIAEDKIEGTWLEISGARLPAGAQPVVIGALPSGARVYVCRVVDNRHQVLVGRVTQGIDKCLAVDGKRPALLGDYELLVVPGPDDAAAAKPPAGVKASAIGERRMVAKRVRTLKLRPDAGPDQASCASAVSAHSTNGLISTVARYGRMDDQSGAYIEERFSDGYTLYLFPQGTLVAPPGGARVYCPVMVMMAEMPLGTPPVLPSDPARGARWVQHHNAQLLDIIRTQIANDDSTLQQIQTDEHATAGEDLFQQTNYLTGIARFYAAHAP